MPHSFYSDPKYRKAQSAIVRACWENGVYKSNVKTLELRNCKNPDCKNTFEAKPYSSKVFCSQSCAAHLNNTGKKQSLSTKSKISKSISSFPKDFWDRPLKPKVTLTCFACNKKFKVVPYLAKTRKYCSNSCAISTIGKLTTSPKASKGKPGIRKDVGPNICFYSTWEANMARVYNLVGIKWLYAPKIFNLGKHTYRPDFYLPDFNTYIEVKNYLGDYSLKRDLSFRKLYPKIKLELILKDDYTEIKSNYKYFVSSWEF